MDLFALSAPGSALLLAGCSRGHRRFRIRLRLSPGLSIQRIANPLQVTAAGWDIHQHFRAAQQLKKMNDVRYIFLGVTIKQWADVREAHLAIGNDNDIALVQGTVHDAQAMKSTDFADQLSSNGDGQGPTQRPRQQLLQCLSFQVPPYQINPRVALLSADEIRHPKVSQLANPAEPVLDCRVNLTLHDAIGVEHFYDHAAPCSIQGEPALVAENGLQAVARKLWPAVRF